MTVSFRDLLAHFPPEQIPLKLSAQPHIAVYFIFFICKRDLEDCQAANVSLFFLSASVATHFCALIIPLQLYFAVMLPTELLGLAKGMVGFVHSGVTAHTSRLCFPQSRMDMGCSASPGWTGLSFTFGRVFSRGWVFENSDVTVGFWGFSEHCDCFIPTNLQVLWLSSCLSLLIHRASALQLPLMG